MMKIGNYIAIAGIIIGFLGLIMLPIYNFHELPFVADFGYAKGSGWKLLAQSGVFKWLGLKMLLMGVALYALAKVLPSKFLGIHKEKIEYEVKAGKKRIKKHK